MKYELVCNNLMVAAQGRTSAIQHLKLDPELGDSLRTVSLCCEARLSCRRAAERTPVHGSDGVRSQPLARGREDPPPSAVRNYLAQRRVGVSESFRVL